MFNLFNENLLCGWFISVVVMTTGDTVQDKCFILGRGHSRKELVRVAVRDTLIAPGEEDVTTGSLQVSCFSSVLRDRNKPRQILNGQLSVKGELSEH